MKRIVTLIFLLASFSFSLRLFAQSLRLLEGGVYSDSSYYEVIQVGPDVFWAGGENGLLRQVDADGQIQSISFPDSEVNILKMVQHQHFVYVGCDQGKLFRYNMKDGQWNSAHFGKKFAKKCFYDMLIMENGDLLVGGGNQKIAKAGKSLPMGFIAQIKPDLTSQPVILWDHPLQFVWSLVKVGNQNEYLAASYNGIQTTFLSSVNQGMTWQRKSSVHGLVHHLGWDGQAVWYTGCKNPMFTKKGIVGKMGSGQLEFVEEGCIWTLLSMEDHHYGLAYDGSLIQIDRVRPIYRDKQKQANRPLYEAVAIDDSRALVVGHARQLYIMELESVDPGK